MSTKGIADVVFCIDVSASMAPCIDGVRKHISSFINGLTSNSQQTWDLRLDFVAHSASESVPGRGVLALRSLKEPQLLSALYEKNPQHGRFFTSDPAEFCRGLESLTVLGDEAPLIGLDFCLDFPWRNSTGCHRVIIMLTDEPFEQSALQAVQKAQLSELINKIHGLHVMLFLVAPESPVFDELASADRSEYEVIDEVGRGLEEVDFSKVLQYIGKSISNSTPGGTQTIAVKRGLYDQNNWGQSTESLTGS